VPDPTAASRQRINVTEIGAVRDIDREVSAASQDRAAYAQAILTMLAQALSVEQLEEVCHHAQWPLDLNAIDKVTAARAILNHIGRIITEYERAERASVDVSDYSAVMRTRSAITLQQQIAARWRRHLPAEAAP
jgi:hypothetical protein